MKVSAYQELNSFPSPNSNCEFGIASTSRGGGAELAGSQFWGNEKAGGSGMFRPCLTFGCIQTREGEGGGSCPAFIPTKHAAKESADQK
jgi:hypothetical protein